MPRKHKITIELPEVFFRKLRLKKEKDGFGEKDWSEWARFLAKDVRLTPTQKEMVQEQTKESLLQMWMQNFAQNLPYILKGKTIANEVPENPEEDLPKGPAIVVGAGPSIWQQQHLDLLAERNFKGLIISTDRMLVPCLEREIIPDYVASVDGSRLTVVKWYENPIVDKYGKQLKACLITCVAHNVVKRCRKAKMKIRWFHPFFDDWRDLESFTRVEKMMTTNKKHPHGVPAMQAGGNCIAKGTLIFGNDHIFPIEESTIGDKVYSINPNTLKIEKRKITNVIPKGTKQVYKITTRSRTIEATENHKFLVLTKTPHKEPYSPRNKKGQFTIGTIRYKRELNWKPLSKLSKGDYLLVLREIPDEWKPLKLSEDIETTEDLLRVIGAFVGDGYIRVKGHRNEIVWCFPKNTEARRKYIPLLENLFKEKVHKYKNRIALYSRKLALLFNKLQLNHRASEKFVPDWIFQLPKKQKLAFIEGLLDADGYLDNGNMAFEFASKKLVDTLKMLAISVGLRPSNLYYRKRRIKQKTRGKEYDYVGETWRLRILVNNKKRSHYYVNYRAQYDPPPNFALDHIQSIKPIGKKEVYDITIEGNHNFIANGVVAHNCGTTCWILAHALLRRSPVALIGIDFGYPEGTPIEETAYYSTLLKAFGDDVTKMQLAFRKFYNPLFKTYAFAESVFQHYRSSFLELVQETQPWVETINCTEGGTLFGSGIKGMKFKEFLEKYG